jgi:hypothetical protein
MAGRCLLDGRSTGGRIEKIEVEFYCTPEQRTVCEKTTFAVACNSRTGINEMTILSSPAIPEAHGVPRRGDTAMSVARIPARAIPLLFLGTAPPLALRFSLLPAGRRPSWLSIRLARRPRT